VLAPAPPHPDAWPTECRSQGAGPQTNTASSAPADPSERAARSPERLRGAALHSTHPWCRRPASSARSTPSRRTPRIVSSRPQLRFGQPPTRSALCVSARTAGCASGSVYVCSPRGLVRGATRPAPAVPGGGEDLVDRRAPGGAGPGPHDPSAATSRSAPRPRRARRRAMAIGPLVRVPLRAFSVPPQSKTPRPRPVTCHTAQSRTSYHFRDYGTLFGAVRRSRTLDQPSPYRRPTPPDVCGTSESAGYGELITPPDGVRSRSSTTTPSRVCPSRFGRGPQRVERTWSLPAPTGT